MFRHRMALPVTCAMSMVACATFRFAVLASGGAPATIDSGNWLAFGRAIFGPNVRSSSIVYPPVVPIVMATATGVLGPRYAVALVGGVVSALPALGLFVVLRGCRVGWVALPLAVVVAASGSVGEAAGWGGFPQLAGMGLLLLALVAVDAFLVSGTPRAAARMGLCALALAATSDLVFGSFIVVAALVAVLRVGWSRDQLAAPTVRHAGSAMIGVAFLLPVVPLYLTLGSAVAHASRQTGIGDRLEVGDVASHLEYIYRDLPWVWRPTVVLALLTPVLLRRHRTDRLWVLQTAITYGAVATTLVLRQDRFLYLLTLSAVLGLGLWVRELSARSESTDSGGQRSSPVDRWLIAAVAAFAVMQCAVAVSTFPHQRDRYQILDSGFESSINWIRTSTDRDALIAVPSVKGAPAGWWVEGLGERESLGASPLRWLNFEDERRRARIANEIFTPDFPSEETLAVARDAGVAYLLIPEASEIIDRARLLRFVHAHGDQVVFERDGSMVLKP